MSGARKKCAPEKRANENCASSGIPFRQRNPCKAVPGLSIATRILFVLFLFLLITCIIVCLADELSQSLVRPSGTNYQIYKLISASESKQWVSLSEDL